LFPPLHLIAMATSGFLDLEGGPAQRALLWLSSLEVFRCRELCKTLDMALESDAGLLDLWHGILVQRSAGQKLGSHSSTALWLHGLIEASDIARYADQARRFQVLGDLCFQDAAEVRQLGLSCQNLSCAEPTGSFFAGSCRFNPAEVKRLLSGGSTVARSQPFCLGWRLSQLRLNVRLQLTRSATAGAGAFTVALEAEFLGDLFVEELDCVDLLVSGGCLVPSLSQCEPWQWQKVMPQRGVAWELGVDIENEELRDSTGVISKSHPILQLLLQGLPLTCAFRVLLLSMGEEQVVESANRAEARYLRKV